MLKTLISLVILAYSLASVSAFSQELYLRILDVKEKKYFNTNFTLGEKVKVLVNKLQKDEGIHLNPGEDVAIIYEGHIYRGDDRLIFFPSSEYAFLYYGEKLDDFIENKIPEVWSRLEKFGIKKNGLTLQRSADKTTFARRPWNNFEASLYFKTFDEQKTARIYGAYQKHIVPPLKKDSELLFEDDKLINHSLALLRDGSVLAKIQNWILHHIHYLASPEFDSWNNFATHPYFRGTKVDREVQLGVKRFLQEIQTLQISEAYQPFHSPDQTKVMVLTSSGWGGGHLVVAQSIKEALQAKQADGPIPLLGKIEVEIVDIKGPELNHDDTLWNLTQGRMHSIDIYDEIYQKEHDPELADAFWLVLNDLQRYMPDALLPALKQKIREQKPDLIISCLHHYTNFIDLAYSFSVPLAIIGTDFGLQGKLFPHIENLNSRLVQIWTPTDNPFYLKYLQNAMHTWEGYFSKDKVSALDTFMQNTQPLDARWDELTQKIPVIKKMGFPLRKEIRPIEFAAKLRKYKKEFGITTNKNAKVLMLTMGRQGLGTVVKITKELLTLDSKINFPLYLFPLCGNNLPCLTELTALTQATPLKHIILTPQRLLTAKEINKLYALSDLVISKPGGATTAELLRVNKNLAALDYHPWERDNLDVLKEVEFGTDLSPWLDSPLLAEKVLEIISTQPNRALSKALPTLDWESNLIANITAFKNLNLADAGKRRSYMRNHQDYKNSFDLQLDGKNKFNLQKDWQHNGFSKKLKVTQKAVTKPNIVMIFMDTVRRDFMENPSNAPAISKFQEQNLHAAHMVASATATHHLQTALFHSVAPLYRESLIRNNWSTGSPTLQLFKKAGYHLHLLGRPNQYYDVVPPAADLLYEEGFWSDLSQMQLMFGQRSAPLLSSAPAYDGAFSDYDKYSMAGGDAHTVEVELPALLKGKPQNTPGVYLFILDAAHDRYSWNPELPHDPLYRKIFEASTFNNHFTRNPQWAERGMQEDVLKAYRNSVRNIDKNIAGIFAQLKANNLYDNSIIVLFSDHGERLYESYGSWYEGMDYSDKWLYENIGHGGPAFNKVIDVGLVVKPHARFGKDDLLRTKLYFNMMSHQNIFPLLLEMADIDGSSPNPEDQLLLERINRKKILSAPHATNCQVSFSPNGSEDPYILAFVGENYKAMMHLHYGSYLMDEPDFSEVTFRVDAITNRNDVEITLGERSPELFFKEHFSSCLSAMGL